MNRHDEIVNDLTELIKNKEINKLRSFSKKGSMYKDIMQGFSFHIVKNLIDQDWYCSGILNILIKSDIEYLSLEDEKVRGWDWLLHNIMKNDDQNNFYAMYENLDLNYKTLEKVTRILPIIARLEDKKLQEKYFLDLYHTRQGYCLLEFFMDGMIRSLSYNFENLPVQKNKFDKESLILAKKVLSLRKIILKHKDKVNYRPEEPFDRSWLYNLFNRYTYCKNSFQLIDFLDYFDVCIDLDVMPKNFNEIIKNDKEHKLKKNVKYFQLYVKEFNKRKFLNKCA